MHNESVGPSMPMVEEKAYCSTHMQSYRNYIKPINEVDLAMTTKLVMIIVDNCINMPPKNDNDDTWFFYKDDVNENIMDIEDNDDNNN